MSMYDFKQLPLCQRRLVLQMHGTYLGHRKDRFLSVLLYQLNSYYVEVFFSEANLDIYRIEAFDDIDLLEPYLSRIDISELKLTTN